MSEPETAIFLELNLWDDVDNFDKEQESDSRREVRRTLRLEQQFTQSDSGSVVWDCGRVLFDFFKRHQHDFRGKFVLELGSGTGICGLGFLALCGGHMILTDQEFQLPLMKRNLERNMDMLVTATTAATSFSSVDIYPLKWDEEKDIQNILAVSNGELDLIIASDCVYGNSCHEDLVQLLLRLLERNRNAVFILSYENRPRSKNEIELNRNFTSEFFETLRNGNNKTGYLDVVRIPSEELGEMQCDEISLWTARTNIR